MKPKPQLAMDERVIEDRKLEKTLEERQSAKEAASTARKTFTDADLEAKGALAAFNLEDGGIVRIGRFRVTQTVTKPREVSFETEAKTRLNITVDKD